MNKHRLRTISARCCGRSQHLGVGAARRENARNVTQHSTVFSSIVGNKDSGAGTRARWFAHPAILWVFFAAAHVWTAWLNLASTNQPLGDVTGVYTMWVTQAVNGQGIVGITAPWVYPIAALAPLMLASLPGMGTYGQNWLVMVSLLDALAFFFVIGGWRRPARRIFAAWWWIAFVLCLGPITLGRLDSVVAPLAVLGLMFLLTRPRVAALLLTLATWIKVWPVALLLASIAVVRKRWTLVITAAIASAVIVVVVCLLGGGAQLLTFLTQQTNRGIQIESPLATPFVWLTVYQVPGYSLYYDQGMLTFQVAGDGVDAAGAASNLALGLAVLSVLVLGWVRLRRGTSGVRLLAPLALALVMSLIVFNKVGSPQYMTWIIAPVVLGLIVERARFAPVAIVALLMAALTQVFYPFYYDLILVANPLMVSVLTARNTLEVVVLAMAVYVLASIHRPPSKRAQGQRSAGHRSVLADRPEASVSRRRRS